MFGVFGGGLLSQVFCYCAYIVTDAAAQYQKMAVLQLYENVENAHLVEILVEVEYLSLVIVVASLVVELPLGQEL